MKKTAEKGPGTQGGIGPRPGLATALAPLVAGMTATRASLLDWVHGQGVVALQEVFTAEAEGLAGPKGQHQVARTHHHWGTTGTELTFGGRRIQVTRPRVRSTGGRAGSAAALGRGLARAGSAGGAGPRADLAGRVDARVCREPGGGTGGRGQPRDEQERGEPHVARAGDDRPRRPGGPASGRSGSGWRCSWTAS